MAAACRWAVLGGAPGRALVLDGLKSLADHGLADGTCVAALSDEPGPPADEPAPPAVLPEHLPAAAPARHWPSAEAFYQDDDRPPLEVIADSEPLRALQGLARGCHVLLDWPECLDVATVRDAIQEAAERGLLLAAAFWPRHDAVLAQLAWGLRQRMLGELREVCLGCRGGPVELAQAVALLDWLVGPLTALRYDGQRVEARLAGGGRAGTVPAACALSLVGESGRYQAGWLNLPEGAGPLGRWFALRASASTKEELFPRHLLDTTGRALWAFQRHLTAPAGDPAAELLRATTIADSIRESANRGATWVEVG